MSEPESQQPLLLPDWLLAYVGRLSLELEFRRSLDRVEQAAVDPLDGLDINPKSYEESS